LKATGDSAKNWPCSMGIELRIKSLPPEPANSRPHFFDVSGLAGAAGLFGEVRFSAVAQAVRISLRDLGEWICDGE
jgi:hypothetical protein